MPVRPGDIAGLKIGDLIKLFDGKPLFSKSDFLDCVASSKACFYRDPAYIFTARRIIFSSSFMLPVFLLHNSRSTLPS